MCDEYFCVLTNGFRSVDDAAECPYYKKSQWFGSTCKTIYAEDGLCSVVKEERNNRGWHLSLIEHIKD